MRLSRPFKLLALLLTGAWLPVTFTCSPEDLNGVIRFVTAYPYDTVVVEDPYYDGCCGWWGDSVQEYQFDLFYHHDEDDD